MPGFSDYAAQNGLNWITGQVAFPALPSVYLALFTTAPTSDAGTGGVEVSGGAYARVQAAGTTPTNQATTSGGGSANTLRFTPPLPAWIVAGMTVRDITSSSVIPAATTISSVTSASIIMTANVTGAGVASGDSIGLSAWSGAVASSGLEPNTAPANTTNGAILTFAQAVSSWGTVTFCGLFDASGGGNFLGGDYLGNFNWLPGSMSAASPGVFTTHAHGYSSADPIVFTVKYGGTLPTFSNGNLNGVCTVTSPAADTFTVTGSGGAVVNTSATGDLMVKKIVQQSIPQNVTASFAASAFTLQVA